MLQNLTGWHALVILAIVLLVFGSAKLPSLARSVGESVKILKDEAHKDDGPAATTALSDVAAPATARVAAVEDEERRAS